MICNMRQKNKIHLKPLGQFAWALFFWAFAVVLYNELDKLEVTGSSVRVPSIIAMAYSLGGKWGAVAVFVFIGGVCLWSGLNMFRTSGTRGEDLRLDVRLGFYEAIFGNEKEIRIQHLELISRGKVAPIIKELTITIPAGVDSGTRLRITEEGDASPDSGRSGDLYVYLEVPPEDGVFRREGSDIISELKITAEQARKGENIRVETIDGEATIVIPPGTGRGDCLKVMGHGVPKLGSPNIRGDHVFCVEF